MHELEKQYITVIANNYKQHVLHVPFFQKRCPCTQKRPIKFKLKIMQVHILLYSSISGIELSKFRPEINVQLKFQSNLFLINRLHRKVGAPFSSRQAQLPILIDMIN